MVSNYEESLKTIRMLDLKPTVSEENRVKLYNKLEDTFTLINAVIENAHREKQESSVQLEEAIELNNEAEKEIRNFRQNIVKNDQYIQRLYSFSDENKEN